MSEDFITFRANINTRDLITHLSCQRHNILKINPSLNQYILIRTIKEKIAFEKIILELTGETLKSDNIIKGKFMGYTVIDISDGISVSLKFEPMSVAKIEYDNPSRGAGT